MRCFPETAGRYFGFFTTVTGVWALAVLGGLYSCMPQKGGLVRSTHPRSTPRSVPLSPLSTDDFSRGANLRTASIRTYLRTEDSPLPPPLLAYFFIRAYD